MSLKVILSTALAAVGLGALARVLFKRRRSRKGSFDEPLLNAYAEYLATGILSKQLLLLADAEVLEAIAAKPSTEPGVTAEILAALRKSCGSEEMDNVQTLQKLIDQGTTPKAE